MKNSMFKRIISIVLAGLMAISVFAGITLSFFVKADSVNAKTITYDDIIIDIDCYNPIKKEDIINLSVWDSEKEVVIQGGRSENALVVYDSNYKKQTTQTNDFGTEIIVNEQGVVTAVGKGNLTINKTGFIVSAHGTKADWLNKFAPVGTKLLINTEQKYVAVLPQTEDETKKIYESINTTYNEIMSIYNEANSGIFDIDYNKANEVISKATSIYNESASFVNLENSTKLISNKVSLVNLEKQISQICIVSRRAEERAVWVRPTQTTAQQVDEYVKSIVDDNLTSIYLETWFNGYTIFPTDNKITKQNPVFDGFDVMKAYVDACKKYGINLHAWVENFFAGMEQVDNGGVVVAAKPEWLMKSKSGLNYEDTMYGKYYFLNPAIKECREFVLSIYKEMLEKYEVAGIQLDYVRYPENISDDTDFGYDEATVNGFMIEQGINAKNIVKGSEDEVKFNQYRESLINSFVYECYDLAKSINKNLVVSACVSGNYEYSKTAFKQNPEEWIKQDKIDVIIPMCYDYSTFNDEIIATAKLITQNEKVSAVIGISSQSGYTKEQYINLLNKATILKIAGVAHFEGSYYASQGYDKLLLDSYYREKAVSPIVNKDDATLTQIKYVEWKFENLYKPLMTDDEYNQLMEHWINVKNYYNAKEYDNCFIEMNLLVDKIDDLEIPRQKLDSNLSNDFAFIRYLSREYFSDSVVMPEKQEAIEKDNKAFIIILVLICAFVVIVGIVTFFIIKNKKQLINNDENEEISPEISEDTKSEK